MAFIAACRVLESMSTSDTSRSNQGAKYDLSCSGAKRGASFFHATVGFPTYVLIGLVVMMGCCFPISQANVIVDNNLTEESCMQAFGAFDFRPSNFARYPQVFGETGFMRLALAGGPFFGPQAILEYLLFASDANPYVLNVTSYTNNEFSFKQVVQNGTACQFRYYDSTLYITNGDAAQPVELQLGLMRKLTFDVEQNRVLGIDVYYKPAFLRYAIGTVFNTDQTRATICSILIDSCPAVNELNGNLTLAECMTELATLPPYSNNGNFDGRDQGCRLFHSFIATMNPLHCPHISFVPLEDNNGKIKCQVSQNYTAEQFFDNDDLEMFDAFLLDMEASQVGSTDGFRILSSTSMPTIMPTTTEQPTTTPTSAAVRPTMWVVWLLYAAAAAAAAAAAW